MGRDSIPMWKSLCITGLYIKRCVAVSWVRGLVLSCSSRRPGFITWTAVVRYVVGRVTVRQVFVFSASTSVFLCQYHSTSAPYSSPRTSCCYQEDKRAKTGNLPKSNDLSDFGDHSVYKYQSTFYFPQ
jgi:hypothetical protein